MDIIMKRIATALFICLGVTSIGCDRLYDTPLDDERFNAGINDPAPQFYSDQYDPIKDEGQFWMPPSPSAPLVRIPGVPGLQKF